MNPFLRFLDTVFPKSPPPAQHLDHESLITAPPPPPPDPDEWRKKEVREATQVGHLEGQREGWREGYHAGFSEGYRDGFHQGTEARRGRYNAEWTPRTVTQTGRCECDTCKRSRDRRSANYPGTDLWGNSK